MLKKSLLLAERVPEVPYGHAAIDAPYSVLLIRDAGGIVKEAVAALNTNFIRNITLFLFIGAKLTEKNFVVKEINTTRQVIQVLRFRLIGRDNVVLDVHTVTPGKDEENFNSIVIRS